MLVILIILAVLIGYGGSGIALAIPDHSKGNANGQSDNQGNSSEKNNGNQHNNGNNGNNGNSSEDKNGNGSNGNKGSNGNGKNNNSGKNDNDDNNDNNGNKGNNSSNSKNGKTGNNDNGNNGSEGSGQNNSSGNGNGPRIHSSSIVDQTPTGTLPVFDGVASISVDDPEIEYAMHSSGSWEITKSAEPNVLHLTEANHHTSSTTYTIAVNKTDGGYLYEIKGEVTIYGDEDSGAPGEDKTAYLDRVWVEIRDKDRGSVYNGTLIYEADLDVPEYDPVPPQDSDPDGNTYEFVIRFTDADHSYGSDPLPDGLHLIVRAEVANPSKGHLDGQSYKGSSTITWDGISNGLKEVTVDDNPDPIRLDPADQDVINDIRVKYDGYPSDGVWSSVNSGWTTQYTVTVEVIGEAEPAQYLIDNTASVLETGASAEETVVVNVDCGAPVDDPDGDPGDGDDPGDDPGDGDGDKGGDNGDDGDDNDGVGGRSSGGGGSFIADETPTFTEPETEDPEEIFPLPAALEEVPQETELEPVGPLPKTGRSTIPFMVLGFMVFLGGTTVVFRRY